MGVAEKKGMRVGTGPVKMTTLRSAANRRESWRVILSNCDLPLRKTPS